MVAFLTLHFVFARVQSSVIRNLFEVLELFMSSSMAFDLSLF